jgi:hypothetical protein
VFKRVYTRLTSLDLGLWLLSAVMVVLALGSFTPGSSESSAINDYPLFVWLNHMPLAFSWWLWLAMALVGVLSLNALVCSIDALRKRGRSVAPHIMHAGFLLIVLAHLFSASGSFKDQLQLPEGGSIGFPDGELVRVEKISGNIGAMGMMTNYHAQLRLASGATDIIQPNQPLFHKGYGVYLKEVALDPQPVALFEIHKEPGAIPALLGAILFTVGNLWLLALRSKKER